MLAVVGFNDLRRRAHVPAQRVDTQPPTKVHHGIEVPEAVEGLFLASAIVRDACFVQRCIKLVRESDDAAA